jgi:hypothetical protein
MTHLPPSTEQLIEQIRRGAAAASDLELDEQLAAAVARRDVAATHGQHGRAATWQECLLALDDVRRARRQVRSEVEELTGPPAPVMRPLTAEDLEASWLDADATDTTC